MNKKSTNKKKSKKNVNGVPEGLERLFNKSGLTFLNKYNNNERRK